MMAHLSLPNVDPSGVPATYSKILIQNILRQKLKYDGLIVTDDLEMTGASIEKDIGARAVRAFLAGDDMLLIAGPPSHQHRAFQALRRAALQGKISEERLAASVKRILAYKARLNLSAFSYNSLNAREQSKKLDELSREILKRNFQISLEEQREHWPVLSGSTRTLVMSADPRFYARFAADFKAKKSFYRLSPRSLAQARKFIANYNLVIFYATGTQTAHWLNELDAESKAKMIIVNANNRGEIDSQEAYLSVLNINSLYSESGGALSRALGNQPAADRLPASR